MQRWLRVTCALGVLAAVAACANDRFAPGNPAKPPQSALLRNGGLIDGGGNPNDDMLAPNNRGDVLVLSGDNDFTAAKGIVRNIETISMRHSDRSRGTSTITLDIAHVFQIAGTGFADPPGAYGRHPALHIDGDEDDTLILLGGAGDEGWGQTVSAGASRWLPGPGNGGNGLPAGYDLYMHVATGKDPAAGIDAYLLVQRGVTVLIR